MYWFTHQRRQGKFQRLFNALVWEWRALTSGTFVEKVIYYTTFARATSSPTFAQAAQKCCSVRVLKFEFLTLCVCVCSKRKLYESDERSCFSDRLFCNCPRAFNTRFMLGSYFRDGFDWIFQSFCYICIENRVLKYKNYNTQVYIIYTRKQLYKWLLGCFYILLEKYSSRERETITNNFLQVDWCVMSVFHVKGMHSTQVISFQTHFSSRFLSVLFCYCNGSRTRCIFSSL